MGSREVQRFFPGKFEAADRDQTRRRRSRGGREAEKTRPRCGPDGGVEAEPGPDGRPEEARRDHQVRGASRRSKISTRKRIELLSAFSVRLAPPTSEPHVAFALDVCTPCPSNSRNFPGIRGCS